MSLRRAAASAVRWKGVSTAVVEVLRLLRLVILARLLAPDDFGLMAMLTVVIGFADVFDDLGINKALIQRQDTTRDQLASLYWLNMLAGIVVFMLVWLSTPLVVALYVEPRLEDLMFWAALLFLIAPIGQQYRSLLQKELRFKPLAQVEIAAAVVGTTVAVGSAMAGQGVFAMLWGQLAIVMTKSLLFASIGWREWRPSLHFRISDLKGYVGFGVYFMAERITTYLASRIDYLVIGRLLGAEVLGAYMLAYRLVVMPLRSLNPLLAQVAFPILSRKQGDNAALRRGYLEMIKIIAFVSLPFLVGIGATAPLLVEVLFGEKWASVGPLIQIMVIVGMLGALTQPVGPLVLAKGRPDVVFKWALVSATLNGCVFWYAAHHGVYALALSYVGLITAYFVARAALIVRPMIQLTVARQMAVLLRPTVVGVLLGLALFVVQHALADVSLGNRTLLLALAAFGIVVYGSLMLIFERRYLLDNWYLLVNKNTRA